MNNAFSSCGIVFSDVNWVTHRPSSPRVYLDDMDDDAHPSGMQEIVKSVGSVNVPTLFYFQTFWSAFSSSGVFPVAVFDGAPFVVSSLHNTAWFPFETANRVKGFDLSYSEEVHEMGHLLLKAGHDASGVSSPMADNWRLRNDQWTDGQCLLMRKNLSGK